MTLEIALFPLGAVLFPHMPMELHIFEERYRTMMRDCEDSGRSFGVVGIATGNAAGRFAVPYHVGTIANIREVQRLDDGRYTIMITGATRFRVDALSFDHPYLSAGVALLEETAESGPQVEAVAARVSSLFARYVAALQAINGKTGIPPVDTPSDPELLSYLVAGTLQVDTAAKQLLLETDSATDRLRLCHHLLRREILFAERMMSRRDPRLAAAALTPN